MGLLEEYGSGKVGIVSQQAPAINYNRIRLWALSFLFLARHRGSSHLTYYPSISGCKTSHLMASSVNEHFKRPDSPKGNISDTLFPFCTRVSAGTFRDFAFNLPLDVKHVWAESRLVVLRDSNMAMTTRRGDHTFTCSVVERKSYVRKAWIDQEII